MSEYSYNSNSSNKNTSNFYKKIEEAKETIFKEESLDEANIAALLEKAEGKSPSLLEPSKPSKIVFDKPICDPIGFKQHEGECANDAFQQMILFADELKEITQPYMFDNTIVDKIDDTELKKYIKFMQKRFVEHYGLITGQTTAKAKRRMSFIASSICHYFFPDETIEKRMDDYKAIKNTIGLNKYKLEINGKIDGPGYIMSTNIYRQKGDELTYDEEIGHIVALYKCGGNYYFHDNESGIIKINSEIYKNSKGYVIIRDIEGNKNYIVKPKGIERSKRTGEMVRLKIGAVWGVDKWDGEVLEVEDIQKGRKFFIMEANNRIVINRIKRIRITKRKKRGETRKIQKREKGK